MSEYFSAINGVKQGAVSSRVLFCVHIDDLMLELRPALAAILVLISSALLPMRTIKYLLHLQLLHYANSWLYVKAMHENTAFRLMPSKLSVRLSYRNPVALYLSVLTILYVFFIDNKTISSVKSFTHLGHVITSELADDADIAKCCGNFIGQVHNTVRYFRKLDSFVQNKLFRSVASVITDVNYGDYQTGT